MSNCSFTWLVLGVFGRASLLLNLYKKSLQEQGTNDSNDHGHEHNGASHGDDTIGRIGQHGTVRAWQHCAIRVLGQIGKVLTCTLHLLTLTATRWLTVRILLSALWINGQTTHGLEHLDTAGRYFGGFGKFDDQCQDLFIVVSIGLGDVMWHSVIKWTVALGFHTDAFLAGRSSTVN